MIGFDALAADTMIDTPTSAAPAAAPTALDAPAQDGGGWTAVTDPREAAAAGAAIARNGGASGGAVTLSGPDFLATKDPAYAAVVKAIAEGRRAAPTGMALRTPYGQKLAQDVYQYDPTADDVNLPARMATRKRFVAGADGQAVTSQNTAIGHLFSMAQNVEALNNGSIDAWNAVANAVGSTAGDKAIQAARQKFGVDKQAVIEELARSFKGGNPDVHGVKGWERLFSDASSPTELRSAISEAAKLLASRVNALGDRYNQGMGTANHPLPMLTPHATEGLQQLQAQDYLDHGYQALSVHPDGNSAPGDDSGTPPPAGPAAPVVGGNGTGGGPPPVTTGGATPTLPTATAPPADKPTLSADGSSDMIGSKDKQLAAEANALLANPRSTRADFDALTQKYGSAPYGSDLDAVIRWRNNGGKGASIAARTTHSGPGVLSRVENATIGSQAGQVLNTAGVGLADTGSFGLAPKAIALTNTVGDKLFGSDGRSFGDAYGNELADTHALIDASEAAHPAAALTGQVGGFITGGAALGAAIRAIPRAAALAGRVPGVVAPLADDFLQGSLYGAGSQDHLADVPGAALRGGLSSMAGGVLGRGVAKGVAALASPIANGAVRRLTDAGVTLTPGQVLGAGGGLVGRAVKGIEDRAAGFPIIGDVINSTRRGGVEDFNRTAIDDALAPINGKASGVGHAGVADARQQVSDAYDKALAPLTATPDAQFTADLAAVGRKAKGLAPSSRDQLANVMDTDVQPYLAGKAQLDGGDIQDIKRGLDSRISNLRGQGSTPQDRDLANSLSNVRDAVLNLAGRSDPAAAADFQAANKAHSLLSRVEGAAAKAKDGIFTPNQFRQAVTKRGYGTTTGNVAQASAPMQQLATDASTVLPSTVPDSGTAGREALDRIVRHGSALGGGAVLGGGAGYLEGGRGSALTGALIGAAALSRPGAKVAQWTLAGTRGKTLNTLGSAIRRNAALGGAVGSPLLLSRRGN